jgi:hypothetical protein
MDFQCGLGPNIPLCSVIHIRSVNQYLRSRQPWGLPLHSHRLRESWIPIRSMNPSNIHISHGNPVNSLQ